LWGVVLGGVVLWGGVGGGCWWGGGVCGGGGVWVCLVVVFDTARECEEEKSAGALEQVNCPWTVRGPGGGYLLGKKNEQRPSLKGTNSVEGREHTRRGVA